MPPPKYAARRDINETEIAEALRAFGCSVAFLSDDGLPDLLVGYNGHNLLIEVKGKRGKLTPSQERWLADWHGQVAVARTVKKALEIVAEGYLNE